MKNKIFYLLIFVIFFVLIFFAFAFPFFSTDVSNILKNSLPASNDTSDNTDSSNETANDTSDNIVNTMFGISVAAFSVSTMLYIFFLEHSSHIHRGYRRKRLTFCIPNTLFVIQFIYVIFLAILLILNIQRISSFKYYALYYILISSGIMCTISLLCTWGKFLDIIILWRFKQLLNKRKKAFRRCLKKEKAINVRGTIEININETLRKTAGDVGCEYAKMETSSLDQFIFDITDNLISHVVCISKMLKENKKETKEPENICENILDVCTIYTYFQNICQNLYLGYCSRRGTDKNINFLIGMLTSFYAKICKQLYDELKDSENLTDQKNKQTKERSSDKNQRGKTETHNMLDNDLYTLTVLVSVICCIVEYMDDMGAVRFFTMLYDEQFQKKYNFQKLFCILYARGYYLTVNNQGDSNLPQRYFKNANMLSQTYDNSVVKDIRQFWQVWRKIDKAIPYNTAAFLKRLTGALRSHFYDRRQLEEKKYDTISLLLFGIRDKENLI